MPPSRPLAPGRKTFLISTSVPDCIKRPGVDLTQIDGFGVLTVPNILSKIGINMNKWPTVKYYFWSRFLLMVGWMAVIFWASHRPSQALPVFGAWDLAVKKGGHFLAYAILAVLIYRNTERFSHGYWWAMGITAVYAMSDEFHQTFVPGRNGTPVDVVIDCLGAGAGLAVWSRYLAKSRWGQTSRAE